MRHRSFYLQHLTVSGRVLPSRGGDLIVVSRAENPDCDWEVVHRTTENVELSPAPYYIEMSGPEGDFHGDALLIRSDGRSHVFRGSGELSGFDVGQFPGPGIADET